MVKTVDNTAFPIESTCDHLKELVIALLEFPPHRIRDKVSVLYDARRSRIYEQRNISQVAGEAPGMSNILEFRSESL